MIVAIEGGVGAGKTTLLKGLARRLPTFQQIPEYFDTIPRNKHPYFLSKTQDEKLSFFLEIEKERKKSYASPDLILDRSILSLLGYECATGRGQLLEANIISAQSLHENCLLPDLVIFLDIEHSLRQQRVLQRGYYVAEPFLDKGYNQRFKEFCVQAVNVPNVIIDSSKSPDEIIEIAANQIQNAEPMADKPTLFSRAFNNVFELSVSPPARPSDGRQEPLNRLDV